MNKNIRSYAVPNYLRKHQKNFKNSPLGHRFLLYFQDLSRESKASKNNALQAVCRESEESKESISNELTSELIHRQNDLTKMLSEEVESIPVKLTAPLTTGLGNPHPVENGFSFLSPYGIPYLPGSSIKGVIRRAAEELALFNDESEWTIPLVWVMFGFEETSAYITSPSKLESIDIVKREAERWREAFIRQYAEKKADGDKALKYLLSLEAVKTSIPKELQGQPMEFCLKLQTDDSLRKALSWQGLLSFWDAFFTKNTLEVDILNPHHKEYYEKDGKGSKATPNDAESPKPVFFLTVPPETKFTLHCQMVSRTGDLVFMNNWRVLVREAVEYACEWLGFGAKTSVGYGAGETIREGKKEEEIQEVSDAVLETKVERKEEHLRSENEKKKDFKYILNDFENQIAQTKNLPGEIDLYIQRIQRQEDGDIRKKMCFILLKKANSLRRNKKFSTALKNNKSWAIRLRQLLIENGITVDDG